MTFAEANARIQALGLPVPKTGTLWMEVTDMLLTELEANQPMTQDIRAFVEALWGDPNNRTLSKIEFAALAIERWAAMAEHRKQE